MQTDEQVRAKAHYHHGDLKQQLIAATRILVEEKGQDGFSVSDACRKAGVSTAAPYRHFSDRTEMLIAVALEGKAEMAAAFAKVEAAHPLGSIEAITALGTAYVTYAVANPNLFRMMFANQAGGRSEELEAAGRSCYGYLLHQVAARCGQSGPDETTEATAFPLWTFVHGLSFLAIDGHLDCEGRMDQVPALCRMAAERLLPAKP